MQYVFPDYYSDFKCIADRCGHNCCIGWEIDIDDETLKFYRSVSGEWGKRFCENISKDETPHFILKGERCPFLNDKNLCDIISEFGDRRLCSICADHPRFRNELPDRIETGLGLCCEEAARIILLRKERFSLLGAAETNDEIILLRDQIINLLQQREKPIPERLKSIALLFEKPLPRFDNVSWCERLLRLERLDDGWGELIEKTRDGFMSADFEGFDRFIGEREIEYEQFLVYIIFRHFAVAPTLDEAYKRLCFAALSYSLLRAMGAVLWSKSGRFDEKQQIELARMFSSEIEYSDENLYAIIDSF